MAKELRVGIIGCGGIANGKHLPAISSVKEASLVAFCDIVPERMEEMGKKFGAEGYKLYDDYRKLLADKSIDVVHVLTPNKDHSHITVDALDAGKHVMCEKPMAISYTEAKKMLDAKNRSGKKLTIGYQTRCTAESQYLKKACERGDLGDIYYAKAHAVRRRAVPTWGVFLDEEKQGGGPLIDIGTHALDLTLWMMNNYKPKSVMGNIYKKLSGRGDCGNVWGPWDPAKFTVEDSAFGFITMENGATITLEASWALNTLDAIEAKTTLCGTKAGADMREGLRFNSDDFGRLTMTKPNLEAGGAAFYDGESFSAPEFLEARLWYDAILNDTEPNVTPEQAIVVSQILEGIYESAKTGKLVTF